ncbi:hypothetical protein ACTJKN_07140 [Pedobacter sp. 22163]|uniref:hypothetical protein n=1 Tax=Pedobacter sp. 22163 TaxID=3453883 RepID=UPI003F877CDD
MVKLKTFDLLDAHFYQDQKSDYIDLPPNPRFASSREELIIDPRNWENHYPVISSFTYKWVKFKFDSRPTLEHIIPSTDPGVYIFYIQPATTILDMPKFVLYIGISNANGTGRALRDRLADYYSLSKLKKRSSLMRLLVKYYPQTYIACSTLKASSTEILKLEKSLNGFYFPIANKDDFPVEISQAKKAFNKQ